jgi:hypothetical protein
MPKKAKTLMKLLSSEKEKLGERIQSLLREQEVLANKIRTIKLEKLAVDLRQEKEELEERIEGLKKAQEDVISHLKIVEMIGELKCPKDFQCYKSKYDALCNAEFKGTPDVLHCLEEAPDDCIFSLSYRDTYYCQCPLRNYIAEKVGK